MLKNHQQQAWTVFGKKAQRCHSLTMDTEEMPGIICVSIYRKEFQKKSGIIRLRQNFE